MPTPKPLVSANAGRGFFVPDGAGVDAVDDQVYGGAMLVEQLPSGKWRAGISHNGRRRWATAMPTQAQAKMKGAELMIKLGGTPTTADVTVVELLAAHLDQHDYAPTTREDAARIVDRLPAPFLDRRLGDVTPAVLSALYRELLRAGLSVHRVRRAHMVISSAFTRARRYGWVSVNPARDADVPAAPDAEIHPPSDDDVVRLLDAAPGPLLTFLLLAANTGARRGELVALRWSDLDLTDGGEAVIIRRAASYTPTSGLLVADTKTGRKGHRTIALSAPVGAALREHRRQALEHALAYGVRGDYYVFSHNGGHTCWRPDYITHRFAELRDAVGVDCTLKSLRHYVATTMLADGASVADVAGRLGHTNGNTTLRVYSHFVPARDREHAARLGARLGRSQTL